MLCGSGGLKPSATARPTSAKAATSSLPELYDRCIAETILEIIRDCLYIGEVEESPVHRPDLKSSTTDTGLIRGHRFDTRSSLSVTMEI